MTAPELRPGFQGESGACRDPGRADAGGTVPAVRRARQPDQQWKDRLLEGATGVFGDEAKAEPAGPTVDVKTLHAKIGELALEHDFLSGAPGKARLPGGEK